MAVHVLWHTQLCSLAANEFVTIGKFKDIKGELYAKLPSGLFVPASALHRVVTGVDDDDFESDKSDVGNHDFDDDDGSNDEADAAGRGGGRRLWRRWRQPNARG